MSETWKQWEGHTVDGRFPLLRYLGGSERSAVFLTERAFGERPVQAAIKLVPSGPDEGELQLSQWRRATELSHPHLISLYEMGRCELGGMRLLYVLMEHAEENLAQVLAERMLAPEESRVMLQSVLDALAYLHGKAFVHGHIKPGNVLASGDQLKISTDGLCRAGESPVRPGNHDAYDAPESAIGVIPVPHTMSPACDVWSLGMTLVEAMTQSLPILRTEAQQDPLLPQALPQPFLDIASHCLLRHPQSRWTVAQITARLEGRASEVPAKQPQARISAGASQPIARLPRPPAKFRRYAVPVAVGFALALVALLVGPRLFHQDSEAPQVSAATDAQPHGPLAPSQAEQPPQARPSNPNKAFENRVAEEEPRAKTPVPVNTSIHARTTDEEERSAVEKVPASGVASGQVVRQVLPEVLQSARDSIRGTVRVIVRVDVDRLGDVEDADLASPGPSKYFSRLALDSAKAWKFNPPRIGGQGVLSSWTLRFEFTRDGTRVVPAQETP